MSSKENINQAESKITQVSSDMGTQRGVVLEPVLNEMESSAKEANNHVQQSYLSETEGDQQEQETAPSTSLQAINEQLGKSCRPCSRPEDATSTTSPKTLTPTSTKDQTKTPVMALEPVMNEMQSSVKEATTHVQQSHFSKTERDQDTARSPLDDIVPVVSKETLRPLLNQFCEKLAVAITPDLSEHETRAILAEVLLEIIAVTANEILKEFKDCIFTKYPPAELHVSHKAVKRALRSCLHKIFISLKGEDSVDDIVNLVISEVTNRVNSALSLSKVEDNRLVVVKDTGYKTPENTLKAMVRCTMPMVWNIKDKLSCETPENLEGETEAMSEPVEEKQETAPSTRLHARVHSVEKLVDATSKTSPKTLISTKVWPQTPVQLLSPDHGFTKAASPSTSLKAATEEIRDILEQAVQELSVEDLSGEDLSDDIENTASSIVVTICDELSLTHSSGTQDSAQAVFKGKRPNLDGVHQRIKSFIVLCYAKCYFHNLLIKLCCQQAKVSMENVLEEASYLLKELVQQLADFEEAELYKDLSQDISNGKFEKLSQDLTDIISENMTPQTDCKQFRRAVRAEVDSFTDHIWMWLHVQQQQESRRDPVTRALKKIQELAATMVPQSQDCDHQQTTTAEKVSLSSEPVYQREQLLTPRSPTTPTSPKSPKITDIHTEERVHSVPVAAAQVSKVPSLYEWEPIHIRGLVYEVASRVLQTKNTDDFKDLYIELMQQLEPQIPQWNVKVKPDIRHIKDVAKAVHRDLCGGGEKVWVTAAAQVSSTSICPEIVDNIHKNLVTPEKKRTLGSFLRSVCSAICWWR